MEIIKMPKVGNSVKTCLLSSWFVSVGDYVNIGDNLFSYETDKTQLNEVSSVSGYVLKLLVENGDEVDVFGPIALIGEKGEDISSFENVSKSTNDVVKTNDEIVNSSSDNNDIIIDSSIERKFNFSPRAKKLASDLDINLNNVSQSSGVNNRVMAKDVEHYYQNNQVIENNVEFVNNKVEIEKSFSPQIQNVKFSNIRKAIKKQMSISLASSSQVSMSCDVDVTRLLDIYKRLKTTFDVKVTINDLMMYVLSRVALKYPEVNSVANDDSYNTFNYVSISMAVDRSNELYVPVIKYASEMSLKEIALASKELVKKVESKKLSIADSNHGTITITNVGNTSIKMFTPILNWPQSSIVGVGAINYVVVSKDNNFVNQPQITLSLTFDHNIYDGALGAKFLNDLKLQIENIDLLFIK